MELLASCTLEPPAMASPQATARANWPRTVLRLLKGGADVDGTSGDAARGRTFLHVSCEVGSAEAAALLLDRGADVERTTRVSGSLYRDPEWPRRRRDAAPRPRRRRLKG